MKKKNGTKTLIAIANELCGLDKDELSTAEQNIIDHLVAANIVEWKPNLPSPNNNKLRGRYTLLTKSA